MRTNHASKVTKHSVALFLAGLVLLFFLGRGTSALFNWVGSTANDYNNGPTFDFNYTKVLSDSNVIPTGELDFNVWKGYPAINPAGSNASAYDINLVAYYKFNDKNSDGNFFDDTNQHNDGGMLSGSDINAWGLWDTNALFLDGVNDYGSITYPSTSGLADMNHKGSAYTISAWVYLKSYGSNYPTIFYNMLPTGKASNPWLFLTASSKTFNFQPCATDSSVATAAVNLNTWYQVTATNSGTGSFSIYLNGALANTTTTGGCPSSTSGATALVGARGSWFLDGYVDELKAYNRALAANEIQADYNSWMHASYYSRIFDANRVVDWRAIRWNETRDGNNSISVDYRSCDDANCVRDFWKPALRGGANNSLSTLPDRYFQYRVNFDTNRQNWNAVRGSGTDKGQYARFYDANIAYETPIYVNPKVPQINFSPNYVFAVFYDTNWNNKDVNIRFWDPNGNNVFNCPTKFNDRNYAQCKYSFLAADINGQWRVDANTGGTKDFNVGKMAFIESAPARAGLENAFTYTANVSQSHPAKEVYIRAFSTDWACAASAVVVSDVDNDGVNEGVLHAYSEGKIRIVDQNRIDGGWLPEGVDATDRGDYYSSTTPTVFDFNNDGIQEIVLLENSGRINVFDWTGTSLNFIFQSADLGTFYGGRATICNIFNDGNYAIIAPEYSGLLYIYKWNSATNTFDQNYISPDLGTFWYDEGAACGDWDNDGDDDVAVFEHAGTMTLFRFRAGRIMQDFNVTGLGTFLSKGIIGDFDMDGNKEIFAPPGGAQVKIYHFNNGPNTLTTEVTLADIGSFYYGSHPILADLNKNGVPDIVIASQTDGPYMFEYDSAAATYRLTKMDTSDLNNSISASVGLGDIDGDGFQEVFYGGTQLGDFRVLKYDGNSFYRLYEKNGFCNQFQPSTNGIYTLGLGQQGGDMDNDGDDEIFVNCYDGHFVELDSRDVNSYTASVDTNVFTQSVDANILKKDRELYFNNRTGYCIKEQNLLAGDTNVQDDENTTITSSARLTDSIISTYYMPTYAALTTDSFTMDSGKFQWMRLLLSGSKKLGKIKLWNYYTSQAIRVYDDLNILITNNSDCTTGLTPIFNAAPGGTDRNALPTTYAGVDFYFPAQNVRCIRIGMSGSNVDTLNYFAELQGFEANTDCNWNIVAKADRGSKATDVATTRMAIKAAGNTWKSNGADTTLFKQGHYVWPIKISIVGATEYQTGETLQVVVFAEDADEVPVSGATCDVNIYYPNGTAFATSQSATEIAGTGIYRYSDTVPATEGIYSTRARCASGAYSSFDVHSFHVAHWANQINDINAMIRDINRTIMDINGRSWISAADVWASTTRILTDYNMQTLPAWVWSNSTRNLTDYNMNTLPAWIWSNATRTLTDYNMATLPAWMWVYNTRTLSDYNMATLPAYVWSNPTKTLSDYNMATLPAWIWSNATRTLSDYNMANLPDYIWIYSNRSLTDYNMATLPNWLWRGSSSRTLTDYNQALIYSYLNDINLTVKDINQNNWVSAAGVWAYATRTLSDYNMATLPAYVWRNPTRELTTTDINAWAIWNYTQRTLTDYNMNTLPAYIWRNSTRTLTDYNMANLPDYIWVYNTRTLTDYNMNTLPAYVWRNPTRELTTADINAWAIWNYATRNLTDYNMQTLPAYIWLATNRSLTDYNFTTLPAWLWQGAPVRTLTDYNMSTLPAYVWANPTRTLTDYNMATMPDYMWAYSTRSLTDYNMNTLPAYIWRNPTRELTTTDINAFAVWNYATRALTDYNMATLPAYIWIYANRSLTDYNQTLMFNYLKDMNTGVGGTTAANIWAYATRSLTDYNMANLPAYIWGYDTRRLTDYNMQTLPAYVWTNPTRELTTTDINAFAVWNYATRALTDYNMANLPAYLWVYSNRGLTDYNFTTLPNWIWRGASTRELTTADINAWATWNYTTRALTDYNQTLMFSYLRDVNATTKDINGHTWISAADVWGNATRTLSDYNFTTLPDWIWRGASTRELTTADINAWAMWNYATRALTDYNQTLMFNYLRDVNATTKDINGHTWISAADVWAYVSRTLTDYNMSTLPAYIWRNPTRELTTADINAFAVWNYVSRTLTDYNQATMWQYLRDINATVIDVNGKTYVSVADIWGNGTRTLTDYNQTGSLNYLNDINRTTKDINAQVKTISDVIGVASFQGAGKTLYMYVNDINSAIGALTNIVNDINRIAYRLDNNFVDYNLAHVIKDIATNYGAINTVSGKIDDLNVSNINTILSRIDSNVLVDLNSIYQKVRNYPYSVNASGSGGSGGLTVADREFIKQKLADSATTLTEVIALLQKAQAASISSLEKKTETITSNIVQKVQALSRGLETSIKYYSLPNNNVQLQLIVFNPNDSNLTGRFSVGLPNPLTIDNVVFDGETEIAKVSGKWIASKEISLGARETAKFNLIVENVWKKEFEKVIETEGRQGMGTQLNFAAAGANNKLLSGQISEFVKSLEGTAYYSQAIVLKNDVMEKLAKIRELYGKAKSPEALVSAYEEALPLMQSIENDYVQLASLSTQSSGLNALGMTILGGQVSSTWGIILIVLMGVFVLLGAIYLIWKMNMLHKKEADVSTMVQTTILKELIKLNRGIEEKDAEEEVVEEKLKAESLKEINEEMVRELKTNIMNSVMQDVLKALAAEKLKGSEKKAVEKAMKETERAKQLLGKMEDGMKTSVISRLKDDLQKELEQELSSEISEEIKHEIKKEMKELGSENKSRAQKEHEKKHAREKHK